MCECVRIHTRTQRGCIYICVHTQDLSEGRGQCQTRLACFKRGKVINIPANRVQVLHITDTSAVYAAHTEAAHTEDTPIMETEDIQRVIHPLHPRAGHLSESVHGRGSQCGASQHRVSLQPSPHIRASLAAGVRLRACGPASDLCRSVRGAQVLCWHLYQCMCTCLCLYIYTCLHKHIMYIHTSTRAVGTLQHEMAELLYDPDRKDDL